MQLAEAFRERGIEFALPRLNIEVPRRGEVRARVIDRALSRTEPADPETPLEDSEQKPEPPED